MSSAKCNIIDGTLVFPHSNKKIVACYRWMIVGMPMHIDHVAYTDFSIESVQLAYFSSPVLMALQWASTLFQLLKGEMMHSPH